MAEYKGVLVHCETAEGKLASMATETAGCGQQAGTGPGRGAIRRVDRQQYQRLGSGGYRLRR